MTPAVVLALVLTALATPAASMGLPGPPAAPSSVPTYVPALTVLDDVLHLPAGEAPVVEPGRVCYAPAAHLRLTLALQLAQPLSDERARVAWLYGWQASNERSAPIFDAEHAARVKAEATAQALDARFQAAERSADWEWWRNIVIGAGVFGLGTVAGFIWGVSK